MPGSTTNTTHVLIIGGGFTGISAAEKLAEAGVDFQLLEGHPSRIGGRTSTFGHKLGNPGAKEYFFERGAQYVGEYQTEIYGLAQQHLPHAVIDGFAARLPWPDQVTVLRGKRYVSRRDEWLFGIGGIPVELDLWTVMAVVVLIQEIEAIERAINVDAPWASPPEIVALDQITLAQWFSRPWVPPIARDLVTISVQALLSAEPGEVSALYFFWYCACNRGFLNLINDGEGGPQQFYLSTGLGALLERMAEPFKDRIHLDSPVERIEQLERQPGGSMYAKVTLQDGTVWEADKVIVAMSPSTAGRIVYEPPPEGARAQLLGVPMGRTIKCTVFYDTPWWRDSHGRRYTGLAAAASHPVLWVMDYTPPGPDNKGVYALMTFTVGKFVDALGTYPSREEITRSVTEALAFLFDDMRALSTSEHFIELAPATWNAAESWVGGGPNMLLKPGMLSGEGCAGSALNEPWNGVVFFASTETSRRIEPSGDPVYTPGPDPMQVGTYPDHRQGLGYLDGAVIAGRYVAAQVMGNTPAPHAALATTPAPLAPDEPQALSPDQVKQVLTLLCEALHAASAIQVPAWEGLAPPWHKDPTALQAWFANTLVVALVQSGLLAPPPDPPTPEWMVELTQAAIALIGSGYRYSTRDLTEDMPEARRKKLQSIQELTQIASALMRLRSTEPFAPEPAQLQQPVSYQPAMAQAPHARFTCLSRMLGRC